MKDDASGPGAEEAGAGGVVTGLFLEGIGAHVFGDAHPREENHDKEEAGNTGQEPQTRRHETDGNHDNVEKGDTLPNLHQTLAYKIRFSSNIAHETAKDDASEVNPGRVGEREQHVIAVAVDQA